MDIEICYFSGNSPHVAEEIGKRIPETKLIPIASLLNRNNIEKSAKIVGFVFPIHLAMSPVPVREFRGKLDLKAAEYVFAVATRAGSQHRAFVDVENILKKKGKVLDSFFSLNMVSNDPKFEDWQPATDDEIADLEAEVQNKLDSIQKVILNREKSREKDTNFTTPMPSFSVLSLLLPFLNRFYDVEFYSNSKCAGCETCEKVCLSGKVKMVNEKQVWQEDVQCFYCDACLNYCPE